MSANSKIALGISNPHFWTNLVKRNISMFALIFGPSYVRVCTHIWTPLCSSLHSYLDPLVIKFALILGPTCDRVCTHIWTDLLWSLHSYLDPLVKKFALISGPSRYSIWYSMKQTETLTKQMSFIIHGSLKKTIFATSFSRLKRLIKDIEDKPEEYLSEVPQENY